MGKILGILHPRKSTDCVPYSEEESNVRLDRHSDVDSRVQG